MAEYRIIIAKTLGGIAALAEDYGWTVIDRVRAFDEVDTIDDGSLDDIGRVFVTGNGYIALARREET